MVTGGVVPVACMALKTHVVSFGAQPKPVRFMTIAARDPLAKHPALEEGAVFVNLLLDLAVRKVEVAVQ